MQTESVATDTAGTAGERRAAHNVARKSGAKKSVAALGVALAFSGGGAEAAHAGQWVRERWESQGKQWAFSQPERAWSTNSESQLTGADVNPPAVGITAWTSGTIKVVFKWQGVEGEKPTKFIARVACWAQADQDSSGADAEVKADNGWGDPNPAPFYDGGKWYATSGAGVWGSNKVWHLVQRDGSSGWVTLSLSPRAASASTKLKAQQPRTVHANVQVVGELQFDNRSVMLSRSGAKLRTGASGPVPESDPTLDKAHEEWVEADGTVHGHTTYSYFNGDRNGIPELQDHVPNFQTFNANRSGSWNNPLTWQWQPSEAGGNMGANGPLPPAADTISSHEQEMPDGSLDKNADGDWTGTKSEVQEKIITYTLTDGSDGAKAQAQYAIKVHDQAEMLTHQIADVFVNPRHASIDIVGPTKATATESVSFSLSLAAAANGQVSKFMAGLLAINLQVTATGTVTSTLAVGADVPAGKYTWLEVTDHYFYHRGDADEWSREGYVGVSPYEVRQVPDEALDRYGLGLHLPFLTRNTDGGNG